MPTISQFELYNQPLVEDPNSADMIAPIVSGVMEGTDIAENIKSYIIAQLGRRDIHKFQNVIESGESPSIDFPKAGLNLVVDEDSGVSRIGHLRIVDWVNIWMTENLGHDLYGIMSPDSEPVTIIGIIETEISYVPMYSYISAGETPYQVIEQFYPPTPKPIPEGTYRLKYTYSVVVKEEEDLFPGDA